MKELRDILLVEDEENDRFFVQRAFELLRLRCNVHAVSNGQEAIDYISNCGQYADRDRFPFPELVITDWKMPGAGGLDLLNWIRAHAHFMVVPVIVLTSSDEPRDVKDAYCGGATAYLKKPATQERLAEIIEDFMRFWRHVEKPKLELHTPCETAKTEAPS